MSRSPLQPRRTGLKIRDYDPSRSRSLLESIGAETGAPVTQRDTYFQGPRGRLRLREEPGQAQLFFYERLHLVGDGEPKSWCFEVARPEIILASFSDSLGIEAIVVKQRRVFPWKGLHVKLDDVQGLGTFLKVDAAIPGELPTTDAGEQIEELCGSLEIDGNDVIDESYCDLSVAGRPTQPHLV